MSVIDAASLKSWESFADLGAWLVIIGVAGEGGEIVLKILKHKLKNMCFLGWYNKHEFSIELFAAVFWIMVVVGLAMEFRGNHKAKTITDRENVRLTQNAANLMEHAANTDSNNLVVATELFGLANQTAKISTSLSKVRDMVNSPEITAKLNESKMALAEANRTIANVKEVLTSSNLSALKITDADRTITPEQEANLVSELKPYTQANFMANMKVSVIVEQTDVEALMFASRIADVLRECGFVVELNSMIGFGDPSKPIPTGFGIFVNGKPPQFATEILNDFQIVGLVPSIANLDTNVPEDHKLTIRVFHKPSK
jgi:hypothetical protein